MPQFKGAAGKIGSVGGSDGSFLLTDDHGYCDGPGNCPILLSYHHRYCNLH